MPSTSKALFDHKSGTIDAHSRVASPTTLMEKDSSHGKFHTRLLYLAKVDDSNWRNNQLQLGHSPGSQPHFLEIRQCVRVRAPITTA
jgi:hypothetical protein